MRDLQTKGTNNMHQQLGYVMYIKSKIRFVCHRVKLETYVQYDVLEWPWPAQASKPPNYS